MPSYVHNVHIHNVHISVCVYVKTVLCVAEDVLLFFKYYDPTTRVISYMGHSVENIGRKFREL